MCDVQVRTCVFCVHMYVWICISVHVCIEYVGHV